MHISGFALGTSVQFLLRHVFNVDIGEVVGETEIFDERVPVLKSMAQVVDVRVCVVQEGQDGFFDVQALTFILNKACVFRHQKQAENFNWNHLMAAQVWDDRSTYDWRGRRTARAETKLLLDICYLSFIRDFSHPLLLSICLKEYDGISIFFTSITTFIHFPLFIRTQL